MISHQYVNTWNSPFFAPHFVLYNIPTDIQTITLRPQVNSHGDTTGCALEHQHEL